MISIKFKVKSDINKIIRGFPSGYSLAINDALYTVRDRLVRETWPQVIAKGARGKRLAALKRRAIGRAVLLIEQSDSRNLSGRLKTDIPVEALQRRKSFAALSAKDWIHAFVHSTHIAFVGKSRKDRIRMALGAYYRTQREYGFSKTLEKIDTRPLREEFNRLMLAQSERRFARNARRSIAAGRVASA